MDIRPNPELDEAFSRPSTEAEWRPSKEPRPNTALDAFFDQRKPPANPAEGVLTSLKGRAPAAPVVPSELTSSETTSSQDEGMGSRQVPTLLGKVVELLSGIKTNLKSVFVSKEREVPGKGNQLTEIVNNALQKVRDRVPLSPSVPTQEPQRQVINTQPVPEQKPAFGGLGGMLVQGLASSLKGALSGLFGSKSGGSLQDIVSNLLTSLKTKTEPMRMVPAVVHETGREQDEEPPSGSIVRSPVRPPQQGPGNALIPSGNGLGDMVVRSIQALVPRVQQINTGGMTTAAPPANEVCDPCEVLEKILLAIQDLGRGGALQQLTESAKEPENKKKKKPLMEGIKNIGEGLFSGSSSMAGELGDVSKVFEGVSKAAESIPGPVGVAVQGISKLGEISFGAMSKIRGWIENVHQANMRFAEFSGSMAAVAAEQHARDIAFSQDRGEERAGSARALAEAKSKFDTSWAPVTDFFANFKNTLLTGLATVLRNPFGKESTPLSGTEAGVGTPSSLSEVMIRSAAQAWQLHYGRPPDFAGDLLP